MKDIVELIVGVLMFILGGGLLIGLGYCINSADKTDKVKRAYYDAKTRYYENINKSLEKENLQNVDSEK